ncbi:MAG: type II CAAX endopeptidase family protein [Ornithinimicrobium sp.]
MTKERPGPEGAKARSVSHPRPARDILIVGSPIIVMGIIGNLVGVGTLAGGAIINLGYLIMILFGARLLKSQGSGWREIGLRRPVNWFKTVWLGVAAFVGAVVLFVTVQNVAVGLLGVLGMAPSELDQSRFNAIEGSVPLFVLMVALAWTTIAFGEELFYRAFLITRMVDHTHIGPGSSILIAGAVFGVVHFAEGPIGVLANASFGIFYGWLFLRSRRNLWITILGHGLINTLRFALLFAGA